MRPGSAVSPVASFSFTITSAVVAGHVHASGSWAYWHWCWLSWTWRRRVGQLMRQKRHLEEAVQGRTKRSGTREDANWCARANRCAILPSTTDLTGLWNHRIIVERLRGEVDRSRREGMPLSIILVDLDYFKRINDAYGPPGGRPGAARDRRASSSASVRSYDWVGRYGGEEFLLILPGSDFEAARAARRGTAHDAGGAHVSARASKTFSVTASFGVAAGFPTNHEEMIQRPTRRSIAPRMTGATA